MPAPDVQYCLDSMMELHEIPGNAYVYLMDIRENVNKWFDNINSNMANACIEDYDNWRNTASRENKAYVSAQALEHSKFQLHDVTLAMTWDVLEKTNNRIPYKKEIKEFGFSGKTQTRFLNNFDYIVRYAIQDLKGLTYADVQGFSNKIHENRRKNFEYNDRPVKQLRKDTKFIKKVAAKSVSLAEQFLGKETTRIFLGNDYIDIIGKDFKFKVRKQSNLFDYNHLEIKIHDKISDDYLCNLCFYYDNTPIADQLVALMLDIQAGNEDKVMSVGNCFKVSNVGAEHKLLKNYYTPPKKPDHPSEWPFPKTPDCFDQVRNLCKQVLHNKLRNKYNKFISFDQRLALGIQS